MSEDCKDNFNLTTTADLLQRLGFIIKHDKSQFVPSHQLTYLGFLINSSTMTLSLLTEKVHKIMTHCRDVLQAKDLTVRDLAKLIGRLSSSIQAVFPAPLFYRSLQQDKGIARHRENSYETEVILSPASRTELETWISCIRLWNSQTLLNPTPDLMIQTDASLWGWGACLGKVQCGGRWSLQEQSLHINNLELHVLAVFYALKSLVSQQRNIHIRVQVDNMTALSYINHKDGTHSHVLSSLAVQRWTWCLAKHLTLSAEYLPGVQNTVADNLSRVFSDRTEWQLLPGVFQEVTQMMGFCPSVDLFASRLNTHLPRFVSWLPDLLAWRVDAFTINWKNLEGYLFPSFALLAKCLQKIFVEKALVLLIAPVWKTQPWYPRLLELAVETPVLFPRQLDRFRPCHNGQYHAMRKTLQLAAWKLSGDPCQQEVFRSKCPPSSYHHGAVAPTPSLIQLGTDGTTGVFDGNLILFEHL
ncbi:uncharacterized protein LOC119732327 [Patiria miniata]|uniref:Uncharacterized protein n=1 Tax=Patiria miniata TaxID=46514 RepID=A0A914AEC8_PATMI|nr:uncharacterized protein LOC119732327 [Patiria miniata]